MVLSRRPPRFALAAISPRADRSSRISLRLRILGFRSHHDFGGSHLPALDFSHSVKLPDSLEGALQCDLEHELIAGLHRLAKSCVVDRNEVEARFGVRHHSDGLERKDSS